MRRGDDGAPVAVRHLVPGHVGHGVESGRACSFGVGQVMPVPIAVDLIAVAMMVQP